MKSLFIIQCLLILIPHLWVSRLPLQPDRLPDDLRQLGALLAVPRGAQRQGVAHVAERVHGDHARTYVRLK